MDRKIRLLKSATKHMLHVTVNIKIDKNTLMKKEIILVGLIFLLFSPRIFSQNNNQTDFKFPQQIGYVNDFEGLFTTEQISELDQIIKNDENKTSNEIVIVSINSFAPYKTLVMIVRKTFPK